MFSTIAVSVSYRERPLFSPKRSFRSVKRNPNVRFRPKADIRIKRLWLRARIAQALIPILPECPLYAPKLTGM